MLVWRIRLTNGGVYTIRVNDADGNYRYSDSGTYAMDERGNAYGITLYNPCLHCSD